MTYQSGLGGDLAKTRSANGPFDAFVGHRALDGRDDLCRRLNDGLSDRRQHWSRFGRHIRHRHAGHHHTAWPGIVVERVAAAETHLVGGRVQARLVPKRLATLEEVDDALE